MFYNQQAALFCLLVPCVKVPRVSRHGRTMADEHATHSELRAVLQLCSFGAGTQTQPSWSTRGTLQTLAEAEGAAAGVSAWLL